MLAFSSRNGARANPNSQSHIIARLRLRPTSHVFDVTGRDAHPDTKIHPPQSPRKRGEADSLPACGEGWGGVSGIFISWVDAVHEDYDRIAVRLSYRGMGVPARHP